MATRRNDDDRHSFASNEEWLYDKMIKAGGAEMAWVRKNRALIAEVWDGCQAGTEHAHERKYGHGR